MITKNHYLLTANEEQISTLVNFEAIEHISDPVMFDVLEVWRKNKTPVCMESEAQNVVGATVLQVPHFNIMSSFRKWAFDMGFESGEYVGNVKYDSRNDTCVLCSIGSHQGLSYKTSVYNQHVPREVDCIIYESPNFFVTSEFGALLPGFLMIVPKKHDYFSVAQFPDELFPEYQEVCDDVEELLLGAFKTSPILFFEHGSGPSGWTSHKKSIVHAHTHVVPGFIKIEDKYIEMVQARECNNITEAKDVHYFAYQEGSHGQLYLADNPDVYVQRQYPRQIIAEKLGLTPGQYNWRRYEFRENTHMTLYRIFRYLVSGNNNSRIIKRCSGFITGYPLRETSEEY